MRKPLSLLKRQLIGAFSTENWSRYKEIEKAYLKQTQIELAYVAILNHVQ